MYGHRIHYRRFSTRRIVDCMGIVKDVLFHHYFYVFFFAADYIQACSKSDPNFNKCATESARKAFPRIAEGDRKFGTIGVKPLILPSLEISTGEFKISFQDFMIRGLENMDIKNIEVDFEKNKGKIMAHVKELDYEGKYTVKGRILVLPIQGEGDCKIKFGEGDYELDFDLEYYTEDGVEHAKLTNTKVTFTLQKAEYHLDNLFNGDKTLGDEMNKVLNENWESVLNDLREAIAKPMAEVSSAIANGYFGKVPLNEVLLD